MIKTCQTCEYVYRDTRDVYWCINEDISIDLIGIDPVCCFCDGKEWKPYNEYEQFLVNKYGFNEKDFIEPDEMRI